MRSTRTIATVAAIGVACGLAGCGDAKDGKDAAGSASQAAQDQGSTSSSASPTSSPSPTSTSSTAPQPTAPTSVPTASSPSVSTVPAPSRATGGPSSSSAPTAASSTTSAAGGIDSKRAAARTAILRTPFPGDDPDLTWDAEPRVNAFDASADLSYIQLATYMGSLASPMHIALFHKGKYLGTATKEPYGFEPQVTRLSDGAIQVEYTYPRGEESWATRSGRAVAQFRWSAAQNKVVMTGSVPPPPV